MYDSRKKKKEDSCLLQRWAIWKNGAIGATGDGTSDNCQRQAVTLLFQKCQRGRRRNQSARPLLFRLLPNDKKGPKEEEETERCHPIRRHPGTLSKKKYFVHQLLTTGRESKRPAAQNTLMSRILPSLIHAGKIKLFGCRPITFITNVRRCDRLCRKTIQAEDDLRSVHQINSCWCDYNSSFFDTLQQRSVCCIQHNAFLSFPLQKNKNGQVLSPTKGARDKKVPS